MHLRRFSFMSVIAFLISPLAHAFSVAASAVAHALDIAFPAEAIASRALTEVPKTEAVVYGAGKARTRSFLSRIAQRDEDRSSYGALGLTPA